MKIQILLGVCVLATAMSLGSTAEAGGFHPSWGGSHVGFSQPAIDQQRWTWRPFSMNRSLGYIPTPPYFALHPPVSYSYPISAPYGLSPAPIASYAPRQRVHFEQAAPEPLVVINPYVTEDEVAAVSDQDAPMPEIVDSPPSDVTSEPEPQVVENDMVETPEDQEEADSTPMEASEDSDPFGLEN
ncbi:MAG: hypothetical protein WD045_08275 [Pirellulaceae bacterium]